MSILLNQYEPNVKAIIAFLKLLKVKVNGSTINETLQNHPDWPSMLCISDSFNKWNIPNGAGKIEPDKIDELPVPFIAYTNNREYPLAVITETGGFNDSISYEDNPAIKPVRHLLGIAARSNGDKKINHALDDWYLANKKDYDVFAKKYPLNEELTRQGNKIEAMDKWCKGMEVHATPTIFINGNQLPDAYGIEDLQYFLAE